MKISALRLFNVKRFAGRGVAIEGIGDGVNVLCAVNEFGKSTSFEALHALFFQPHSGTPGAVQALRPYAGGNPIVQADIATDAGRYRITKQYYGGRSARVVDLAGDRLVAQADEAEAFIAGLVRGGTAGPAGLLWVRQGITGIEKRSRAEEDGEKQVRAGLLESVRGEVEAVTGGRRMAEIMSAVEAELARLVTATGRPKTGERYAAAIDHRDHLEAEERRLSAEVNVLRDALDRRAATGRRLAELDRSDDRDERRRSVEAAQAAYDAARSQADAIRAAEAELRLVQQQHESAARELEAFRSARAKAERIEQRREDATRQRADALARRDAASEAVARARAESDLAEREEREAQALLARLDAALRARDAADKLAGLEKQLQAAEAARQAEEAAESELALLRLPDKAIKELESLDIDIARAQAVAEAARPSVAISYEPGAVAVSLDGQPLEEGTPRGYDGQARLSIPGVGIMTLRSSRTPDGADRLPGLEERRRVLLGSMGVADLAAARRRQVDTQRKEGDLRELKARFSMMAPDGLPALRAEVARRRESAGESLELKEDPAQIKAACAAAATRHVEARQTLRAAEPAQAAATDALVSAQTALAGLDAEHAQLDAILGPKQLRLERDQQLSERLDTLEAALGRHQATVDGLRERAVDLASAEATLRRVRSAFEAAEKEAGRLREEIAGLTAEIRARADDAVEERWREASDGLAAARARAASFEREVAVLTRLRSSLETARSHARETYLLPVMTELKPLLGLLFDDVSITFDERTLLPQTIHRNGQEEDVDRLSGGMREQLSVLTRLAFARLLAKDGRPAPVILDDALVYSDDDRIEKMFDALHRQAREQQIIVFSCRQRAFQKLGGNVLHMTDWQPD